MRLIGHLIIRLVAIAFGLVMALLAAGVFLSIGLFGGFFEDFFRELNLVSEGDDSAIGSVIALIVLAFGFIASLQFSSAALLPATIGIAMAELMRWQGMVAHLVLGGLVGLFTGISIFSIEHSDLPSDGTLIVLLATGFVGGFFYWLFAGRGSGNWQPKVPEKPLDVMEKFGRRQSDKAVDE